MTLASDKYLNIFHTIHINGEYLVSITDDGIFPVDSNAVTAVRTSSSHLCRTYNNIFTQHSSSEDR